MPIKTDEERKADGEIRLVFPSNPEIQKVCYRALRRFWLRCVGWTGLALPLWTIGLFTWAAIWFQSSIDRIIAIMCALGMVAGAASTLVHLYWLGSTYRSLHRRFFPKSNRSSGAELWISAEKFGIVMNGDESAIPWGWFKHLWQFPDCWILIPDAGFFAPLPTSILDEHSRRMIETGIIKQGGKVSRNPGLGPGLYYTQKIQTKAPMYAGPHPHYPA